MIVRASRHGTANNYALARQERASGVSAAAGHDTSNLDPALSLLRGIKTSLVGVRPPATSRQMTPA
jgi:hypothetical protein